MRWLRCKPGVEALVLLVGLAGLPQRARAEGLMDIPNAVGASAAAERDLQLNVVINGNAVGLIGGFRQLPDGSLATTPEELRAIGLIPAREAVGPDGLVRLNRLPGVTCRLNEATQTIEISAPDNVRVPHVVDLRPATDPIEPERGFGGVLNYTLFGSSDGAFLRNVKTLQGLSGSFDGRVFTPYGTFGQSFIAGTGLGEAGGLARLDSTWAYSDPRLLLTYRAGDTISGGLSWTRSVRLGGFQVQRNFTLRPDLITMPIPLLSGTAAVPSTLDVYTQNVKTYSGAVPQGPFQVVNLPVATGPGAASVVLHDALGRETVATLPFYVSGQLLREGLYDFSAEVGFARRFYGIQSNDYDKRLMASGTIRYGFTNWLTLEAHSEGGGDLVNAGTGAVFSLGPFGVGSLALAGSRHRARMGALLNASIEASFANLTFYARTQRTFGDYQDIASVTAPVIDFDFTQFAFLNAKVPKALDQFSLGIRSPFDPSTFNLTYTQLETAWGDRSRILGLSYSRSFFRNSTIFATAFKDLDRKDSFGLFAGISMPLAGDINASTGIQKTPVGTSVVADAMKPERLEEGSYGWRVRDAEGKTPDRSAAVSYRSSLGRVELGAQQFGSSARATAQLDGSVAFAGGGVFFGNRIDDAFAVVDAGAPNVAVQYENRPIGVTNSRGLLLVPYLNSFHRNKISIDPKNLPVDADVESTRKVVVPADRSGVVVKFGVSETPKAALVTFTDRAGKPLTVGAQGRLEGSDEGFVIGYDGQAYIRGLSERNAATVEIPEGESCRAEFDYTPQEGEQVTIKGVICQ